MQKFGATAVQSRNRDFIGLTRLGRRSAPEPLPATATKRCSRSTDSRFNSTLRLIDKACKPYPAKLANPAAATRFLAFADNHAVFAHLPFTAAAQAADAPPGMHFRSSLISGLGFALAACALWGAIFLVPAMLPEFSPLQITFGRFVLYGVVALCVFLPRATRLLPRLQVADIRHLVWLALTGNVVYFALVATAVQWIGMAVTSLIVGLVPVTVPLLGRNTHGALPLRRMLAPMVLILAGIVLVNAHALTTGPAGNQGRYLLGVLMAVLAMLCWSRYALDNTRYLAQSRFNGTEWSTLWGLVVGLISALLWVLLWLISPEASGAGSPDIPAQRWQLFWLLNLAVAILSSWLGNWMWNAASQRLPITFVGQLLVFETLFALTYHFLYEQRLPLPAELAPMLLILAGVVWSLRRYQAASRAAASV